jgi:hypothetical protein
MLCKSPVETGAIRREVRLFMEKFSVARTFPALDKKRQASPVSREPEERLFPT